MNPHRKGNEWMYRNAHYDEIGEERLTEIIGMLQRVAKNTKATLPQVIDVYSTATRNRLTEVLLDSGDNFDEVVQDFKKWHFSDGFVRLKLSGDYLADVVKVKIETDD